jgi:hypothetical protein
MAQQSQEIEIAHYRALLSHILNFAQYVFCDSSHRQVCCISGRNLHLCGIMSAYGANRCRTLSRIVLHEFKRVHERFDQIDDNIAGLSSEVSGIHRRLVVLEDAVGNATGFAKEIDHLLSRVVAIEKHLGLTTHIKA